MSIACKQGIKYQCPHMVDCESNGEVTSFTNPENPHLIYTRSKTWSSTTRTWADRENIYTCQPKNERRRRNFELIQGETFYEQDRKKVRHETFKEAKVAIEKLIVSERNGVN